MRTYNLLLISLIVSLIFKYDPIGCSGVHVACSSIIIVLSHIQRFPLQTSMIDMTALLQFAEKKHDQKGYLLCCSNACCDGYSKSVFLIGDLDLLNFDMTSQLCISYHLFEIIHELKFLNAKVTFWLFSFVST